MFMGMPLKGAWWLVVFYTIGWILNILGEELWYRGFMLPRQELAHMSIVTRSVPGVFTHAVPG